LQAKLGAFDAWNAANAGAAVEQLGLPLVREILAAKAQEKIDALIVKDKALEPEATSIANVEKLVRLVRDFYTLFINFVSFKDFYSRKTPAIFQAGRLYLDQRSCDLCLMVEDAGKHGIMAGLAGAYLAYVDCVRKGTGEKLSIVAIFSQGDNDNLMVGRNGIFYDRKGRDFDATIAKILSSPISVRQAFFSPYKKLVRMVEENAAKRAAAAANANASLQTAATSAAGAAPAATPNKIDTGTLAAIGLVLTTLLGALGGIFGKILGLQWWQIPLAFLAILLAISMPSVIIAWLKLRKRNLGPILDANGWAVNARAKMNIPFGTSLTGIATLPPGSQRDLVDPFAEKKSPWPKIIVVLVILVLAGYVLNKKGLIYKYTGIGSEVSVSTNSTPTVISTNLPTNLPAAK
jgi:hypothetical protein